MYGSEEKKMREFIIFSITLILLGLVIGIACGARIENILATY